MKTLIRICNAIQFVCLAAIVVWGFIQMNSGRDLERLFSFLGFLFALSFLPSTCIAAVALWAAVSDSRRTLCVSSVVLLVVIFPGCILISSLGMPSLLLGLWSLQAIVPLITLYGVLIWPEQASTVKSIARNIHAWRWPINCVMAIVVTVAVAIGLWRYTEGFTLIRWNDSGEALSKHPARLSGATLRDKSLQGLHLANVTISNAVFENVKLQGLHLTNVTISKAVFENVNFGDARFDAVTFDNCVFIGCNTRDAQFGNAIFKGGRFVDPPDKEDPQRRNLGDRQMIQTSDPTVLLTFDNVTFARNLELSGPGSIFLFRNCRTKEKGLDDSIINAFFLSGDGARVRLQGCDFRNIQIHLGKNSALYAEKSSLGNANIDVSTFYMEGCTVAASIEGGMGVIRDSIVQLYMGRGKGSAYLVGNTYKNDMRVRGSSGNSMEHFDVWMETPNENVIYILGKGDDPVRLALQSGVCVAENVDLQDPSLKLLEGDYSQGALHLHNVSVHGGVWMEDILWRSSFHTVRLYPAMKVLPAIGIRKPAFEQQYLSVFAVSEPKGSPWEGKAPQTRPGKAEWTPVHVPTPEELGMADLRDMR